MIPPRPGGLIDATTLTWAAFAVVQTLVIAMGAAFLHRARQDQGVAGRATLLVAAGALLVLVNAWWFATGGSGGESSVPMRGGTLGAWLSIVTGVEIALLGVAAHWLSRRT